MDVQAQSKLIQGGGGDETAIPDGLTKTNRCRRYWPQVVASLPKNLLTINTSLFGGLPSLIIPSLLGLNRELNPNETLSITPSQASWIASLASVIHPFAAIAGWLMSDAIGRRKSLFIATIPVFISWSLLGYSESFLIIVIAFIVMGLGLGLKEAASLTYVAETCEPSIRGVLLATTGIFASFGGFMIYFLGALLPWRSVAWICISIPISVCIAIIFTPETPIWLLSIGNTEKALKALQRLRGGVPLDTVLDEYQNLQLYSARSRACSNCAKKSMICDHKESFIDKLKQIKRKRILKPFILALALQLFLQFSAMSAWRPYVIQILKAYTTRWNSSYTAVLLSSLGFVARFFTLLFIRTSGKRKLYLAARATTCFCLFGLAAIGFMFLPSGLKSFHLNHDVKINSTALETGSNMHGDIALVLIFIMQFAENVGIANVSFVFICEIFPFRSRSMFCSIITGVRYILAAVSTKLYYNIEMWLSLSGAAVFYGLISLIGFAVMYLILPETDGRTLEDIEIHYSDNKRSITDTKIQQKSKQMENV